MRYDSLFKLEMRICQEYSITHSELLEEWDAEDRYKAIAIYLEDSETCAMCGTAEWEWEEDPYAYEPVAKICKGCEAKDYAREASDDHAGLFVTLRPREK